SRRGAIPEGEGRESFPFLFPAPDDPSPVGAPSGANGMSDLETLTRTALGDIAAATALDTLESLRVALLGKSGTITGQLKQLGALPPEQRRSAGEAVNRARDEIAAALAARKAALEEAAMAAKIAAETIDVTL